MYYGSHSIYQTAKLSSMAFSYRQKDELGYRTPSIVYLSLRHVTEDVPRLTPQDSTQAIHSLETGPAVVEDRGQVGVVDSQLLGQFSLGGNASLVHPSLNDGAAYDYHGGTV